MKTQDVFPFTRCLISFYDVLKFSVYKSDASFVRSIPKYFVFLSSENEIVFLILFLVCLLLVYRNTIDFHMLILFPVIRTHFLAVCLGVDVCMPAVWSLGFSGQIKVIGKQT